jgi:iron complex transport system ATP-binding protein
MSALLEAASISVRAGAKMLLNGVNLSFEPGRIVALVGPNGAGKSTLLRVLAGELKPQSGEVRLQGREIARYAPSVLARHRAVLSQRVNITFPFTVADVVRMGADRSDPPIEALVEAALAEVELSDLAGRVITHLSGGEQQRAQFARVLVQLAWGRSRRGAGILLLDEPTAGLDLRHQLMMLDSVKRHADSGALVIAILHDLNLAALFAHRVVVLHRGRVDCDGLPRDTITDAMLERVFAIDTQVGRAPASAAPFLLPHCTRLSSAARPPIDVRH